MQSSGIAGGEFTSTSILLSVSRRKFYEAVPGVTVNLFLYFAKMKSPDAASRFCVCLSLYCFRKQSSDTAVPSQRSGLFILIRSGRGYKKEISYSILDNKAGCGITLKSLSCTYETNLKVLHTFQ